MVESNSNKDNPKRGKEFQLLAGEVLGKYFGTTFEQEVPFPIGEPAKNHKFDCYSQEKSIVLECKCYVWTSGKNTPQGKKSTLNETAFYLSFLPENIRKYIVMKKSVHPTNKETFAEYYKRIDGHLLRDIHILEIDDNNQVREIM